MNKQQQQPQTDITIILKKAEQMSSSDTHTTLHMQNKFLKQTEISENGTEI